MNVTRLHTKSQALIHASEPAAGSFAAGMQKIILRIPYLNLDIGFT